MSIEGVLTGVCVVAIAVVLFNRPRGALVIRLRFVASTAHDVLDENSN
jgi:hypothetical protein